MRRAGLLETMASGDLEAVTRAVGRGYRPGSVERLAARDPEWHAALERAEREVGALYASLCEADGTLERWREAVGELYRVWSRVNEAPADDDEASAMPVCQCWRRSRSAWRRATASSPAPHGDSRSASPGIRGAPGRL